MMIFERTENRKLVEVMIRHAWDRPEMMRDGASLDRIPELPDAHFFLGLNDDIPVALFIGIADGQSLDLHVCMTPRCRGPLAAEALSGFLNWLPQNTRFTNVTGRIPGYNKPMIHIALKAGCLKTGKVKESVMRNGIFEDEILMERRLA